ncbi:MAG: crotonase/enoyl-CoA hydratase family protein [Candidatus Eremiobacteraeota bacterium]|nr:crotonase/enoyl-CoA hydratase family protein [Candidatus Eremiobacteraeota bacterium]
MNVQPRNFETLSYDVTDGIATIALDRPEKLNAFTSRMMLDLIAAFDVTDADDAVRAVIVTGTGRAFCAGADLGSGGATFDYAARKEAARDEMRVGDVYRDGGGRVTLRIFDSLKPVIAAINGPAVGIGATMLLPMDVRLAANTARIGFVFSRRGITPEAASSWFLPRLVGISTALEWCYSGRIFDAAEAKERGLVRSLYEPDQLLPAARQLALELTQNSAPVSIALTRQMMWKMQGADHPMVAHQIDSRSIQTRGASDDVREGVGAFLEKRAASFPNKVSTDLPDFYPWWPERSFQ